MAILKVTLRLQRNLLKKLWDLNKLNGRYQPGPIYLCLEYFLELFTAPLLHASYRYMRLTVTCVTICYQGYYRIRCIIFATCSSSQSTGWGQRDQVSYSGPVRTGHKRYPLNATVSPKQKFRIEDSSIQNDTN